MFISIFSRSALSVALASCVFSASAADYNFTGNLYNNTDRVHVSFEVVSQGSVSLWSDSWSDGQNFDPIAALWMKSGSDYTLVEENDDAIDLAAGQGFYDTGMQFNNLAAGTYVYTVGASFAEPFAKGILLSEGFVKDGIAPTPISQWNQPSYDLNANDQKGTFYSLRLSGVDNASISAVPEPETYAMLLAGLGLMTTLARRRNRNTK